MKISTSYKGINLTGVVLTHTPYFLEVAITSPVAKLMTSRTIPSFARAYRRFEGKLLEDTCAQLLIELHQVASSERLNRHNTDNVDGLPTQEPLKACIGHDQSDTV